MFKLLTGHAPFENGDRSKPRSLRGLRPDAPSELVEIVERSLAESPDERFQAPHDLEEAIRPLALGADLPALLRRGVEPDRETVRSISEPTIATTRKLPERKSRVVRAVALVTILASFIGVMWGLTSARDTRPQWIDVPFDDRMKMVSNSFSNFSTIRREEEVDCLTIKTGSLTTVRTGGPAETPMSYRLRYRLDDEKPAGLFFGANAQRDVSAMYHNFHTITVTHAAGARTAARSSNGASTPCRRP
ncbi:MAG: hypothetical protein QM811_17435 [Pirellulales bacterium]